MARPVKTAQIENFEVGMTVIDADGYEYTVSAVTTRVVVISGKGGVSIDFARCAYRQVIA